MGPAKATNTGAGEGRHSQSDEQAHAHHPIGAFPVSGAFAAGHNGRNSHVQRKEEGQAQHLGWMVSPTAAMA